MRTCEPIISSASSLSITVISLASDGSATMLCMKYKFTEQREDRELLKRLDLLHGLPVLSTHVSINLLDYDT